MAAGLQTSLKTLVATRNEAAVPVLLAGMEAPLPAVREASTRALLEHGSDAGFRGLVARWHSLPLACQRLAYDAGIRLELVLQEAIASKESQLFVNGCDLALKTRSSDLIPSLVVAVMEGPTKRTEMAARMLLKLAEQLSEECAHPRDYHQRRDPHVVRQNVMSSLEGAAQRYHEHNRSEIIDAFLLLASRENPTLKAVLHDTGDRHFKTLTTALSKTLRPAALRLLVSFLDDPHAPLVILRLLARRQEPEFVRALLARFAAPLSTAAKEHAQTWDTLAVFENSFAALANLKGSEQRAAVLLAVASGMPREKALDVIEHFLFHGLPEGRRAAAAALAEFLGTRADDLVFQALNDPDVEVQALALALMRQRNLPGATGRLLSELESEHDALRAAARENLVEFSFLRYAAAFDNMAPELRPHAGRIVKLVDGEAVDRLKGEFHNAARQRRVRALEMARAMGVLPDLEGELVQLLEFADDPLKIEIIKALEALGTVKAQAALRDHLLDPNPQVQDAAERALGLKARDPSDEIPDPFVFNPLSAEAALPELLSPFTTSRIENFSGGGIF